MDEYTEAYNQSYLDFLEVWNVWIQNISIVIVAAGLLISLYYFFKKVAISDPKLKHDYINENEINMLWYSMLTITIGVGLWINVLFKETVKEDLIFLIVRLFVTASFTTIFALIFNSLIKVYYPFYVEKKLSTLRHKPRINPNTGNKMKLMSEDDEDDYLTPEMIDEEARHAVDYDVWLDEETGYTNIEKYDGSSLAVECPSCGYRTLRVENEEIIRSPTKEQEGELLNYYKCSYCAHRERRTIVTKKLAEHHVH